MSEEDKEMKEYLDRRTDALKSEVRKAITSRLDVSKKEVDLILQEIDISAYLWQATWSRQSLKWLQEKYGGDLDRDEYDLTDAPNRIGAEVFIGVMQDYEGCWTLEHKNDRLIMQKKSEE